MAGFLCCDQQIRGSAMPKWDKATREWRQGRPGPPSVRFADGRCERVLDQRMPPPAPRGQIGAAAARCEDASLEPPVQRPDKLPRQRPRATLGEVTGQ